MTRASLVRSASLLCVCAVAAACQPEPAPPDLGRPPAVQSAMWSLAVHTNRITDRLDGARPITAEELAAVKSAVDDIAKIAAGLAVDPAARKHPIVKRGIGDFQRSVTLAQAGLAKDPPDLDPLRALSASCRACHARERPAAPYNLATSPSPSP